MKPFFLIWSMSFFNTTYSQHSSFDSSYFSNDLIRYEVVIKNNRNISKKDTLSGLFVLIHMTLDMKNNLKKLDKDVWISKLTNESSDWAAELLLYYLYSRHAELIAFIDGDRKKWLQVKNKEIKFWNEYLSKRQLK